MRAPEPGSIRTGTAAELSSNFWPSMVADSNWCSPYAVTLHVRICSGGGGQPPSLSQPIIVR